MAEEAISIPAPISEAAQQLANKLGMSRSEFYVTAIAAYVEALQGSDVTQALDQVYAQESSALDPVLLRMQVASLASETW